MNITILDKSTIKHNGHYLEQFQTYNDIDEVTAAELIKAGEAKEASEKIAAISHTEAPEAPRTPEFNVAKNGGFVAEAVVTPEKKKKLKDEGKLDETPVTGKDTTQPEKEEEPVEKTVVFGPDGVTPLTEEEIAAKESAVTAGEPTDPDKIPTVGEAQVSGEEVK